MRFGPRLLLLLLARLAYAQGPEGTRGTAPGTVSGVVRDSIARVPLSGARVQLVGADETRAIARSTTSDARGRFALADIPAGRYTIGFFHPLLDSLGVEPPLRRIEVRGGKRVRADLAIPSPKRLRQAICGPRAATDGGMIMGFVRDARDGATIADARVAVQWMEFTIARGSLFPGTGRRHETATANGFYAFCGVPSPGSMALMASRGGDSTGWIEVQTSGDGFLRRELYLGHVREEVERDSALGALLPLSRRIHRGDGQLRGTVVTLAQGRPLMDALVAIVDGPETRTNDRGEFVLTGVPPGSRTLIVRAVGYYPAQRPVDVVAGAPPVRVELMTFKAMLDTVKITARRIVDRYRGFEERRRTGAGRYYTPELFMRWRPRFTSDIMRRLPGLHTARLDNGTILVVRGMIATDTQFTDSLPSGMGCQPSMYLNGLNMFTIDLESLDDLVKPEEIDAIEVYVGGTVPPQYDHGRTGCGSVVIWTI